MDVVTAIENCDKGRGDRPSVAITIADCGELGADAVEPEKAAEGGEAKATPIRAEL